MVEFPFKPDFDVVGRRLYFVFCISLEVEEDEEKTHETTGIGVIEEVPLFYTAPRALCNVCTMYKFVYGGAIFIATKILRYSASSTTWFSLIMEIPEGRNMERNRDVGDAGRCLKQSSKRSYGAKKKRFAGKSKQNRWSFTKEGTPVSKSKEERHLMWKGIDFWAKVQISDVIKIIAL